MSDLLVLRYAIDIGKKWGKIQDSIPLYLPKSPAEEYERIQYKDAFELINIEEGLRVDIKGVSIEFKRTDHPIECYAASFREGCKKLVYSGDTRYDASLIGFIANADLFLCDGGIPEKYRTEATPHLSAKQAAELAAEAHARRLILTHFYPDVKLPSLLKEAQESFSGIIEMAEEGKIYFV
jgi:ribonuclease BN (tRNA processing enzyme)